MKIIERNNKTIHFYISYDYYKKRGKQQTMILFLDGYFEKNNALKIPINAFLKDFITHEQQIKFIEKHKRKIDNWVKKILK